MEIAAESILLNTLKLKKRRQSFVVAKWLCLLVMELKNLIFLKHYIINFMRYTLFKEKERKNPYFFALNS